MDHPLDTNPPAGRTRVSEAVLSKLAIAEAHAVEDVLDVRGLVLGAIIGGVTGAAVGLVQGGPTGLAFGAPAGSAAGAALGSLIREERQRRKFVDTDCDRPEIILKLTARYGANLHEVAGRVKERVRDTIYQEVGVVPRRIDVEFVEIFGRPAGRRHEA